LKQQNVNLLIIKIEILTMIKKLFACLIALFVYFNFAIAQEWSKEDSIWLQNVLEGKEDLKLNEETKKAIEDGILIMPSLLKKDENRYLDIIKDFEGIVKPELLRKIDPYSMPPSVFSIYIQKLVEKDMNSSIYSKYSFKLTDKEKALIKTPINSYGGGINILGVLALLIDIFTDQEPVRKKVSVPMTEFERNLINQSVNRLRESLEFGVVQEKNSN